MKRFYKDVTIAGTDLGWTISLDGRPLKTQGGQPQVVPSEALAGMMAEEWQGQGDTIDPAAFRFRDMTDYALDVVARDPEAVRAKVLKFAETDTLCFRADPEDPLWKRQNEVWEPIVTALEQREAIRMPRVSGVIAPSPDRETLHNLVGRLASLDPFALAALEQTTALAASLCIGLATLEEDADGDALWDAANLEEDWQADLWGWDEEAEERRARRKEDFLAAIAFARAARAG